MIMFNPADGGSTVIEKVDDYMGQQPQDHDDLNSRRE